MTTKKNIMENIEKQLNGNFILQSQEAFQYLIDNDYKFLEVFPCPRLEDLVNLVSINGFSEDLKKSAIIPQIEEYQKISGNLYFIIDKIFINASQSSNNMLTSSGYDFLEYDPDNSVFIEIKNFPNRKIEEENSPSILTQITSKSKQILQHLCCK